MMKSDRKGVEVNLRRVASLLLGGLVTVVVGGCAAGETTGSVEISLEGLSGLDGYRLLVVAFDDRQTGAVVGGALWTMVDSDPFSTRDAVHPPFMGDDDAGFDDWAAGDYLWDEVARLEPGSYTLHVYANPGGLLPYGNQIPAEPIERTCFVDLEVAAGEVTSVVITDISLDYEPCP